MRKGLPPEHYLRIAEGTITPEQIKDLVANPFVLVDAGYGVVEVLSLVLKLDFGTVAYDTGSVFRARYGDGGENVTNDLASNFIEGSEDVVQVAKGLSEIIVTGTPSKIELYASSDWETGDSPVHYRLAYRVHNI